MRNRKDGRIAVKDLVHHRVWEMPEVVASSAILVFGPIFCRVGQTIDSVEQFDPERIRSHRASLEIPEEGFARLCLRFGQYFNIEGTLSELRRRLGISPGSGLHSPGTQLRAASDDLGAPQPGNRFLIRRFEAIKESNRQG